MELGSWPTANIDLQIEEWTIFQMTPTICIPSLAFSSSGPRQQLHPNCWPKEFMNIMFFLRPVGFGEIYYSALVTITFTRELVKANRPHTVEFRFICWHASMLILSWPCGCPPVTIAPAFVPTPTPTANPEPSEHQTRVCSIPSFIKPVSLGTLRT